MTRDLFVWITARDGSVHATRPPINASGQGMLCGCVYDRRDLRVRAQSNPGAAPMGACAACREAAAAAATNDDANKVAHTRKAPMWP